MVNIVMSLMAMKGCVWISKLDQNKGYHQVPIRTEDRKKTTVLTMDGAYEFNMIGMGLVGASATYQRLLDMILSGYNYSFTICYIDDCLVYKFGDFDDHLAKLKKIFERFKGANLTLNPKMCQFGLTRTVYLGYTIDAEGIGADRDKVRPIKDRAIPKSVTDIRSFLGLCGYNRKLVPKFTEIAKPLTELKKKNRRFDWKPEHMASFNRLKEELSSDRNLAHFDPKWNTEL